MRGRQERNFQLQPALIINEDFQNQGLGNKGEKKKIDEFHLLELILRYVNVYICTKVDLTINLPFSFSVHCHCPNPPCMPRSFNLHSWQRCKSQTWVAFWPGFLLF